MCVKNINHVQLHAPKNILTHTKNVLSNILFVNRNIITELTEPLLSL